MDGREPFLKSKIWLLPTPRAWEDKNPTVFLLCYLKFSRGINRAKLGVEVVVIVQRKMISCWEGIRKVCGRNLLHFYR